MKAEDLRIGNYVNYEQTTHKLVSINKDYCSSIWLRDKNKIKLLTNHGYKSIKPIPLTEQWLIDLGFQDNDYTFNLYAKRKKIEFSWSVKVVSTGVRSCFYSSKYKHIKYVHQLQNLYHSLTGKELTK